MKSKIMVTTLAIFSLLFFLLGLLDLLTFHDFEGYVTWTLRGLLGIKFGLLFSFFSFLLSGIAVWLMLYYKSETEYTQKLVGSKYIKIKRNAKYYFVALILFFLFYFLLAVITIVHTAALAGFAG